MTGGGGSAILVNQRNFLSTKINEISVPKNLELVWVKVVPKQRMQVKIFIICGIYSKPSSKMKTKLNDHIAMNYHLLKSKYESARFIFLGDFNDFKPDIILQLSPQLRQTIHYPTCGSHTLDLLITDLHRDYHPPLQDPPLLPDDPVGARPSDHLCNLYLPSTVQGVKSNRQYKIVTVRPLKQSQINSLGEILVNENWNHVIDQNDVNDKLEAFSNYIEMILDKIAPLKKIKIACDDPAWINVRIKSEIRKRNREFDKNGKSVKWKELHNKCKKMCKSAKKNFARKFIDDLKDKDPRSWMTAMKKLGRANHENDDNKLHFENETKSDKEITDEISSYFANISRNFTPLDRSLFPLLLPPDAPFVSEVPNIPEEHEVFTLLRTSKKTASVPYDLPIAFVKEFTPEITRPVYDIFRKSIMSGTYPSRWKTEFVSPHPKILPPKSYQDLRNLSMTEFLSKTFERFILRGTSTVKGLLHYIVKYWDPNQFAVPGASCSHALINLIDFILSSTDDSTKPTAVVNRMADWSKAFNKCNHNIIMRILIAMKVPMWLLRIIFSYLEHRKMILRFRGCSSDPEDIPGGMPQGTLLGVILYILYINPVGFPSEVTVKISDIVHKYWECLDDIPEIVTSNETLPNSIRCVKFMDDATLQESVNLTTQLTQSGQNMVLLKHNSLLQYQLETIKNISDQREMTLNDSKTSLFVVNFSDNRKFQPLLQIPGCNDYLNVISETKLLGYWFTQNMKTHKHVEYILSIAY